MHKTPKLALYFLSAVVLLAPSAPAQAEEKSSDAQGSSRRIEVFIATRREKHGEPRKVAPRGRAPKHLTMRERMTRALSTVRGRKAYARRKAIVEPVFGQIKHARGFRQFLLRGLKQVGDEWASVGTVYNMLKLFTALELARAR